MRITKQVIKDKITCYFGWMSYDKHIKWEISYDAHTRIYQVHCTRWEGVCDFVVSYKLGKNDIAELFWVHGEIPGIMLKDIIQLSNSIVHYSHEERRY